ncbi:hypothetical protein GP913_23110 [Enterobacteriaceae bacterium 8376wG6]|nr:hypothetical protein [Enterobacteriaceae bacterium 8376wG6]
MNTLESLSELARAVRDLIRTGVIVEVQYKPPRCRVQLGGNTTDWLQWPAVPEVCAHGGFSIGEQVLALGGELDTVFVLPVINYQEGLCGRFNLHSRDVQYDALVTIRV